MRYKKEQLEEAVKNSNSWSDVCRYIGIKPRTGGQTHLKKRCIFFNIDYSHFTSLYQPHNKGKSFPKKHVLFYCVKSLDMKLKRTSSSIRKMLIRDGIKKAECEICKLTEWNNQPIPLELDHIDSDHYNNELYNLQILCPNCHAIETLKRIKKRKEEK
jgi:hypothetical protein